VLNRLTKEFQTYALMGLRVGTERQKRMTQEMLKRDLIKVFQRSYRRMWAASRLYWELSKCESEQIQQEILQMMALKSERSAVRSAVRLSRLGGKRPLNRDPWFDRLWRWFLLCCPRSWALSWLQWLEKRDARDVNTLLVIRRKSLAKAGKHRS
jgi:hypothetical protein